ncbi:MAG: DMT family transporter [Rhodobacteraceae bacterium]|nr:DMT family transporter [Paracoccaceae bacterium]
MAEQNTRLGALLMIVTTVVFSAQDVLSRHLAETHSVMMVVMLRFWAFAAFVTILAARSPGGLRAAVHTRFPVVQVLRGLLLVAEVCVMVVAFVRLGLIETHAVFTCYPLLVAALSGPVLGEKVGWRRWTAIGIGFVGVLVILQPGFAVFSPWALLPLSAAFMFALYGLLTRYVARSDAASVSFFWTGVVGALTMTPLGLANWTPMDAGQAGMMALLCATGMLGHWLLIKAYDVAEASAVQPFAYLQLVWSAGLGMWLFDERLRSNVAIGAGLVVAAGLFTLWRQRQKARG